MPSSGVLTRESMLPDTNFQKLQPSRKRINAGDVFVARLPSQQYVFGRVVRTDAAWPLGGGRGATLVYIYDYLSVDKAAPQRLTPDDLLIPPVLTNRLAWSRGYFETVENRRLTPDDLLPQHAFRVFGGDELLDEYGEELDREPSGPVGRWGLASYATIDDDVSRALGIPLAAS